MTNAGRSTTHIGATLGALVNLRLEEPLTKKKKRGATRVGNMIMGKEKKMK